MNCTPTSDHLPLDNLGVLHDQATLRAHELRREAVDDFWRGADAAFLATLSSARRGAQRLAHRLARRAKARHAPCEAPTIHCDGT